MISVLDAPITNTDSASIQRRFGLVSMTGFSCGLMCTWEGMLVYVASPREDLCDS